MMTAPAGVDDRTEVDLAGLEMELGDVGDPQPVGRPSVGVPFHDVGGGRGRLACVRAIVLPAPELGRDAVLMTFMIRLVHPLMPRSRSMCHILR